MYKPNEIDKIRCNIEKNIGAKICIVSKRGKRQIVTRKGIIMKTYPGIFVVKLFENNNRESITSFSYSDILTKSVRLSVAND